FPEVTRMLALAGAEVITVPMNSPVFGPPLEPLAADLLLASAAAQINRVYVAQADRTGTERGVKWAGATVIVDVDGRLQTQQAGGEALVVAKVDLSRARDKTFGERNDVLGDRRPELYKKIAATAVEEGAVPTSALHAGQT